MYDPSGAPPRWWQCKDPVRLADELRDAVRFVDERTIERQQNIIECGSLYGDVSNWPGGHALFQPLPLAQRLSFNVVAVVVDTLTSEITQTMPAPMAMPNGGDYSVTRRAEKINSYWECAFDELSMRELSPLVARDSLLYGSGLVRVGADLYGNGDGRPFIERTFPMFLLVDDVSVAGAQARNWYSVRAVDKEHLVDRYARGSGKEQKEQARRIMEAGRPDTLAHLGYWVDGHRPDRYDEDSPVAGVTEAWRCSTRDGVANGRHVIVCGDAVLLDEPYEYADPPFADMRAISPQLGWWGDMLVTRIAPIQRELNKHLRRIQESMHLHGRVIMVVDKRSGEVVPKLTNNVGTVLQVTGGASAIQQLTPASMPPDVYRMVDHYKAAAFEMAGVSQMSAQSLKPAGLNSGRALSVYNDTQSRRFVNVERSYERLHVRVAKLLVRAEKELARKGVKRRVSVKAYGARQQIEWSKVDVDESAVNIRVMPASAFPATPAGRLAAMQEMVEAGLMTQEQFVRLADVPDLEQIKNELTAGRQIAEWQIEQLLEGEPYGESNRPLPEQDLQVAIKLAQVQLVMATVRKVPAKHLEALRSYLQDAIATLETGAPPAPPPMAPGPGEPMPPGMPPDGAPLPPMPGEPGPMPPGAPPMPPGPMN